MRDGIANEISVFDVIEARFAYEDKNHVRVTEVHVSPTLERNIIQQNIVYFQLPVSGHPEFDIPAVRVTAVDWFVDPALRGVDYRFVTDSRLQSFDPICDTEIPK